MAFRSKRKSASADQGTATVAQSPPSGSSGSSGTYESYSFPIFDGKSHQGIMTVSTDSQGRQIYKVRKDKGWKAQLSHLKKR